MSACQKARTLILESAAVCKLPETDPRSVHDVSSAFGFCNGYIRCADDMDLLTEAGTVQCPKYLFPCLRTDVPYLMLIDRFRTPRKGARSEPFPPNNSQ